MAEQVASYYERAWRWWEDNKRPHGPKCPCLPCADFRVFMQMAPLRPSIPQPLKRAV